MINPLSPDNLSSITHNLQQIIATIPETKEVESDDPDARASQIAHLAATKAAASSALAALAPGPFGWATIIPDLLNVWRIQRKMISDISAVYGQQEALTFETMLYCLFRHGSARIVGELVMEVGERVIVRRTSLRIIQVILQKIGIKVTQRITKQLIGRMVPIFGSAALAAFTYHETIKVAGTAKSLFSSKIQFEKSEKAKSRKKALPKRKPPVQKLKAPAKKKAIAKLKN